MALAMAFGGIVMAPVGILDAGAALLQPAVLAAGFAVAMLSSVVPYSVELEALRKIPARVFGVLMSLEPAVAALAGLLVLGQVLNFGQWAGVVCVVAASAGLRERLPNPRSECWLPARPGGCGSHQSTILVLPLDL